MKRSCLPCWPESLAAKHQCLIKTVAAVKVAIALCQAEITQYEEQHEAENQSVIPKRNMKRSCRHCDGRQFVLTEGTTSPATEIPTPVHDMQYTGHHDDVSQLWSVIRSTKKLREASVVDSAVCGQWMRFPTSNMRPMCTVPSSHLLNLRSTTAYIIDYHQRVINPADDGTFIVYHMVPLVHLVSGHPQAPGSSGILKDAGMRNGSNHGDGIGIYVYASPPYELFKPGDRWCILEIRCWPFLTRLKKGSRGRYVLKSEQGPDSVGSLCEDCEVKAVLHMYSTLPDFMKF